MDKSDIKKRLEEIKYGCCPDCGGKLIVSYKADYLACENQYDKDKTFFGKKGNYCTRMITSLKILREKVKKYGLEMPELSVFLNDGTCESGGCI